MQEVSKGVESVPRQARALSFGESRCTAVGALGSEHCSREAIWQIATQRHSDAGM